jgi:hypothetical protein
MYLRTRFLNICIRKFIYKSFLELWSVRWARQLLRTRQKFHVLNR